jgi:magnesium chelatase subunit D
MHHINRQILPFTAIVGQEEMKKALILNAINPRIGGVLIRGEKGTAKSTAVRALAELLPDIEVANGCPFNCNPADTGEMCDICYERSVNGEKLESAMRRSRVIDLPLGCTEDRVVGTLNNTGCCKSWHPLHRRGKPAGRSRRRRSPRCRSDGRKHG